MEAKKLSLEQMLEFKALFEEQKKRLIYTQQIINENFHVQVDDLMDSTDLTMSELETSMRMRLRNREILYLKKIEEALRRISQGTFGECENCGQDIGIKRLQARPITTFCVNCKEEQESRELQHMDGWKSKSLGTKLRLA